MKMSEYAALHANDGKKIKVDKTVSAQTLVNEIICIKDIARIPKTKYGKPAFIVQIDDETAFFTTDAMTRQVDKMVSEGVDLESFKGCRFLVTKTHIDAHKDEKTGVEYKECDFLSLEFVEEAEE